MPFLQKRNCKSCLLSSRASNKKSRSAAAGTKTKFYHTKEKLEIISGCSSCGKSKEEIIKALKESKVDWKKRLEELKKQGFPTVNYHTLKGVASLNSGCGAFLGFLECSAG